MNTHYSIVLKRSFAFATIALLSTSFLSTSPEQAKPEVLTQNSIDFRGAAKKAIPAVVSIKVENKKKASSTSGHFKDSELEFFGGNQELWEFFGFPREDSSRSQPSVGQASGFLVSADGYILTNNHVVNSMDNIIVQLNDGREFNAKVLGTDQNSDLALIKIEAKDLPYLILGNSDDLEIGQWVAAVGTPFGLQATLTVGVVSAKSRSNLDIARYEDFIQTDAAINRGNSGGPLLLADGSVVGVNTAIATNSASGYMGIGFAVPSNMAKYVMEQILNNGKVSRGYLGVELQAINYNLAQAYGLKKVEGALIAGVAKNSPAEKSGLKIEDIILKYDEHSVENSALLRNAIYRMKPGTKMILTVLRNDKEIQVPIQLDNFPESSVAVATEQKNKLGFDVDVLTPELAKSLGLTEARGVVVTNIYAHGVAAMAGLKKGTLIVAVNRQQVSNLQDFHQALQATPENRPVLLQLKQGNQTYFISMQVN